jgi:hypothetical protein
MTRGSLRAGGIVEMTSGRSRELIRGVCRIVALLRTTLRRSREPPVGSLSSPNVCPEVRSTDMSRRDDST